jgi:hypothetical protein
MNKLSIYVLFMVLSLSVAFALDEFIIDSASFEDKENAFLSDKESRMAMIVPALFVIVSIIFFMLDFGAVGVILGSTLGLVICVLVGIVMMDWVTVLSFITLAGILIYKIGN